jgi:hypothetical protein
MENGLPSCETQVMHKPCARSVPVVYRTWMHSDQHVDMPSTVVDFGSGGAPRSPQPPSECKGFFVLSVQRGSKAVTL